MSPSEKWTPLGRFAGNQWHVTAAEADLSREGRRPMAIEAQPKRIRVDLARSALVVVDMQNDFCHERGWLASIGVDIAPARRPIAPLARLLPRWRAAGAPVVWVNWGARPDLANIPPALSHVYNPTGQGQGLGDELPATSSRVLTRGSWSAAIVDELKPDAADVLVEKHRMSGFWDTPLDSILRNMDAKTLFFAGVNADQCVLHTLADANFLGYDTILIEDCAATTSPDFCWQATLYNVKQIFGFTVESTAIPL
jgi:nicotinamidase-related amidase